MDTFSMTDMGLLRNSNQDSVFCEENPIGRFPNLFLVADGMGGHKAGDLASRLCIAEMVKQIQSSTARTPVSAFEQAIEAANQKVYQCAKEDFDLAGMGTTVVGAMVEDDVAYIANIGDSRFYRLHEHLEQITVDHSLVEEMVQSGEIQKEEMRTHPNKNIITRALGTDDTVRPDCFEVKVEPGDVLLLCSDGLTNMVEDSQIEKIVKENKEDIGVDKEFKLNKYNLETTVDMINLISEAMDEETLIYVDLSDLKEIFQSKGAVSYSVKEFELDKNHAELAKMLEEDFYKSEGELTLKKGLLLAECSEAAGDNTLIYLNEVINALKDITESNIDMVFSYNEKAKDQKTMKIAYLRN